MATPFPFQSGQTLLASQLNAITTLPSTTKTANHTLVIADQGTRVIMNVATPNTVTVNTSIFGAGDIVEIQNIGAGVCTVTAGTATVVSAGPLAIPQNGGGRLVFSSASAATYFPTAVTVSAGLQVASFSEQQASGTNGGTSTSGSFIKRVLNTTILNTITGCTLTSSVIALPAGTYTIVATSCFCSPDSVQIKLRNTTDSADTILGTINKLKAGDTTSGAITPNLNGSFTIASTKNFEIQGRVEDGIANNGLGTNINFTSDNVYTQCTITKVA